MGWDNALPAELGGGTTHIAAIYAALRDAVGVGGSARDQNGLEGTWRAAKAQVISASLDAYERAALQAVPAHAGEHVPVYERVLGIAPGADQNDEDRRLAVVAAWTLRILAQMPEIGRSLKALSPKFELEELSYDDVVMTMFGKMFPAYGDEALGVPAYPNFSSDFILRVTYTLEAGETLIPANVKAQAVAMLNSVLPSWMDWRVFQVVFPRVGLICDGASIGSVLDFTPMES